jgi:hypothetical protein
MKPDSPIPTTRRDWIRASGTAVLALATPGWLIAGPRINPFEPPVPDALSLLDLSLARTLVGHQFEMVSATGYTIARLTTVKAVGPAAKSEKAFSMEFEPIDSRGSLLQDTYQVHHPVLGNFDLFLVPHRNQRNAWVLLATFVRL